MSERKRARRTERLSGRSSERLSGRSSEGLSGRSSGETRRRRRSAEDAEYSAAEPAGRKKRKASTGASRDKARQRQRREAAQRRKQQVRRQRRILAACLAVLALVVAILAVRSARRPAVSGGGASAGASGNAAQQIPASASAGAGNVAQAGPGTPEVLSAAEPVVSVAESAEEIPEDRARPADLPDIDVTSWEFILANPTHSISDYEPEVADVEGIQVDYRIEDAMNAMVAATRDAGCSVYLSSGYRDYYTQEYLFERKAEEYGEEEAARIVARPGTSEHQTGLAADITEEYYAEKDRSLEDTEMYQYMSAHCHEYGFIVRFPDGREDVTGIMYEPWHFRYVGVPAATYIMEHDLTLEEFLAYYGVE